MKAVKKKVWNQVTDKIWRPFKGRVGLQLSYQVARRSGDLIDSQVGLQVRSCIKSQVRHKVEYEIS